MLRKLAIAIAASGAMMSASTIHALGMGNIELDSALNQPLNARIKLLKASELENWEIKPDLAAREEFEKSGVERVFFLNSLKFEVVRDGADVFVDIKSSQPVVEPFLNFLVQVDWPNGRLLREYTLLLDPPVFEEDSMPAEVAAPQEDSFEQSVEEESLPGVSAAVETQPYVQEEAPEYVESESEPEEELVEENVYSEPASEEAAQIADVDVSETVQSEIYEVQSNDTLWEVAVRTRPQRDISPQQAMLAIQDLNPDAFINGNINRLKKNQVLRVPTEEQMRSRTFNEAVADVALQNEAFAQRKAQLDATRKDQAIARGSDAVDGKLTLLASGEASAETERGASGRVDAETAGDQSSIENELNLALENLDKSSRENQELRARLDAMEEQINTLQRLINLKDEQMVALQSGMAAPDEMSKKDIDAAMASPADSVASEAAEALQNEGEAVVEVAVGKEATEDLNFQSTNEQAKKTDESAGAEVGAKAQDKPEAKPKPKPKFVYEPPAEEPFDAVAFAIENPQIPGAVLGALLLALFGISRARKKKEEQASEQELPESTGMTGSDPLDQMESDFEDDFESEFSDLELGETDAGDDFEAAQFDEDLGEVDAGLPESLDEADGHESTDVLGEVDVYLAYNRIEPAKALLEKTIMEQPGRMDVRLKMMEVLSQMDDEDGVEEQFNVVQAQGSDADKTQAAELKSRLGGSADEDLSGDFGSDLGMGLESNSSDELSGLDLSTGDSELDFDLDGLDLDAPAESALDLDAPSEDASLDFDMDLGSADDLSLDVDSTDSGLDLDLDSGLELGGVEEASSEDSSLDFDMDLGESSDDSLDLAAESDLDLSSSDDGGLDFDVPELEAEGDSSDLDLGSDDLSLSIGSTEDLNAAEDEMMDLDLDSDLEISLDADAESGLDLGELDEGLELGEASVDLDLGDAVDLDVPSLDEPEEDLGIDLGGDLDAGLDIELDSDSGLDLSTDEGLSLDDATDDSVSLDSDLELPSLDDEVSADLDLPELGADLGDASEEESLPSLDSDDLSAGEDLPSLDGMDGLDGDMDFLSGTDESETKLDLARAYIDMDDKDGAKEILQEVLEEGSDEQKQEASKLMDSMV